MSQTLPPPASVGTDLSTDVLVVGAGPAGSSAAAWAARHGHEVLLADKMRFPRDKACGDGLTPRAIHELGALGMAEWLRGRPINLGLRAAGFGQTLYLPWPDGALPTHGSAVPRTVLDDAIRTVAITAGAKTLDAATAVDVVRDGSRVAGVVFRTADGLVTARCRTLIVADGARSQLGRCLGRQWHRDTAYAVAMRAYIDSSRSDDPWISSHLELRGPNRELLSGYGWVFPLGTDDAGRGQINIGVGTLATAKHPVELNLREVLDRYTNQRRQEWGLSGELRRPVSALLPMGGAVSGVAGANWVLIGDAAGCVNPLNGEGIDYGLETGRLAAQLIADGTPSLEQAWPAVLREHYGQPFSIARRLAALLTAPGFLTTFGPVGMRSPALMKIALRLMGNLILPSDQDTLARLWRAAGAGSTQLDQRPPWS